jgi:flagellum-specific peptidoglycan hydrolase FlgJ
LFELQRTDYEGWAKGLQQAGYAGREKGYAKMLIKLIEKYNLQSLD